MTTREIELIIEWAGEQEESCREVIDAAYDTGWGDTISAIQQDREMFRKTKAALRDLIILLDSAARV